MLLSHSPAASIYVQTHTRTAPRSRSRRHRHGLASLLAMLYLVVFSALALGFYAATTTASQVAANERTSQAAQLAAESGFGFLRYHLSALDIVAGTKPDKILEEVYQQLRLRLDGTPNLGGSVVGFDGNAIAIPESGYVTVDRAGTQRFRIILTQAGDMLEAKVIGRGSTVTIGRGVRIKFQKANNATAIFNYGVASRGTVATSGASTITGLNDPTKGSILSTNTSTSTPVRIMGKEVSGDISTVNPSASVQFGSNTSIGGTSNTQLIRDYHLHYGVPEPRFPDIDTTVYQQYATNTYTTGMNVLDNVRIPAGTGTAASPLKLNSVTVRGVLYIEGSNVIEFGGNSNLQAVIAVANNPPLPQTGTTNPPVIQNNVISFTGSVSAQPVSTLPASFGDIRKLTGAFIIAPHYRVSMWGNFGAVGGTVVADQFQMGGSAEGTVKGSIITLNDRLATTIDGSADVIVASVGTTEYPPGITFGIRFTSVPGSYLEVPVTQAE